MLTVLLVPDTTQVLLQIQSGPLGHLYRPDTYVTASSGAGNNWAKGCECIRLALGGVVR